ncbi:stage II sporulation protein D [Clostridium aminobutyricum]|uniref:Stage II sporulation protein D n=1 Tax=Clostridium aminobutyricum TaxID=33953 RepID=A0A939IJA2_CLOAM|nr:stage II sporulation protein D [Clostridium aminobutyricum]MBN7773398.1 stage II sporulation protein D [Clostridium aminobutyricum]
MKIQKRHFNKRNLHTLKTAFHRRSLQHPQFNFFAKIASYILLACLFCLLLFPASLYGIYSLFDKVPGNPITESFPNKITPPDYINVYNTTTKQTMAVPFEDYVKGVVAGEMPATFEEEALKAQAVAARTYSLSKVLRSGVGGNPPAHPSAPLCNDTHCQVYRSVDELKNLKGEAWMADGWIKICEAVDSTKGQMMYYDGQLAEQALFHSSSGGHTENSEDVFASAVPYLRSVDSPYEKEATHQNESTSYTVTEFAQKIKSAYPNKAFGDISISTIKILNNSQGGRVNQIQVGNQSLTGRDIRDCLGLASANFTVGFTISNAQPYIIFTSNGYGHGVGMSQYGANGMAEKGYTYKDILKHYYTGIKIY